MNGLSIAFRSQYSSDIRIACQYDELMIEMEPESVEITIRPFRDGERGFHPDRPSTTCIASTVIAPELWVYESFQRLAGRYLPDGSTVPPEDREKIGQNREVLGNWAIRIEWLPPELQAFVRETGLRMKGAIERSLKTIRWFENASGKHTAIQSFMESKWSFDGDVWFPVPSGLSARRYLDRGVCFDVPTSRGILSLLNSNTTEPLGHELWREAWAIFQSRNPRGALVLGIAAAEAGIKQFASEIDPGASWLLENMPSPPLVKLYGDYLSELVMRQGIANGEVRPPRLIRKALEDGVGLRNKVIHGVSTSLNTDDVETILFRIREALWMLDVFHGHGWARAHMDENILAEWFPN